MGRARKHGAASMVACDHASSLADRQHTCRVDKFEYARMHVGEFVHVLRVRVCVQTRTN